MGKERHLSLEAELVLFRLVQEAVDNLRRHCQASKVVTTVGFADGRVRLEVSDNRRGFGLAECMSDLSAERNRSHGVHKRGRFLGGVLTIRSEVGKGTKVIADLPI